MQFEVEMHKNEMGGWVAVAIDWDVKAVGRTESEALALLMEALARHFKTSAKK